jgi:hypothetical protein
MIFLDDCMWSLHCSIVNFALMKLFVAVMVENFDHFMHVIKNMNDMYKTLYICTSIYPLNVIANIILLSTIITQSIASLIKGGGGLRCEQLLVKNYEHSKDGGLFEMTSYC